ncbi:hypothetical protein [Muricoccus aerilatus]|uniref:hypothetical protein n=1 Tax=Muricoccus aerilatus TaxID=452982 RepID=UPI0005C18175|nr:hypothetical protein [Roseomonas aerilata]
MSQPGMAEKTKVTGKGAPSAALAIQRFIVINDKGGIGKTIIIHGLSLELTSAGVDHLVIEAESDPRLQRVLGKDRVIFHALSEDSLRDIRRNPDLVAEYWDAIMEEFMEAVRLLDMGANASKLFWNWWDSGSGRLILGDGTGTGVLIVTTYEVEAMRLAREALRRAAEEMPNARLFLVVNEHQGTLPATHSALDNLCAAAGDRAGEVERIILPRCAAPAWPVMFGMGKPLNELATLRPQDLQPHGYRLGAAARSVADVGEWLAEWRPRIRRILISAGLVRAQG